MLFFNKSISAQTNYDQLKAVLVYQLSNNITWPNEDRIKKINIGYYGNETETHESLKKLSKTKKIRKKNCNVLKIESLNKLDNIHVLFVEAKFTDEIFSIWSKIEKKNILLITENCPDEKYIMLNLSYDEANKKINFQINKANIIIENLMIGPEILLLGGTEVDIRELYHDMKTQLESERMKAEELNLRIKKYKEEISGYKSDILEHKKDRDSLQNDMVVLHEQIADREQRLVELFDSISIQQAKLNTHARQIKRQENWLMEQKEQMQEQNKEISFRTNQLDSLKLKEETQQQIIKDHESNLTAKDTYIAEQNRLLFLAAAFGLALLAFGITLIYANRLRRKANITLERKVRLRTVELEESNKKLSEEIAIRKVAEGKLKTSERNYRAIYNATSEAIFIHDSETGAILDVNLPFERMFGYSRSEAINLQISEISTNEELFNGEQSISMIKKAAFEGPLLFEWNSKRKNGELFWTEIALSISEINGEERILAVVRDITEKKKISQELEAYRNHLEKMVRERTDELASTNEELKTTNEELNDQRDHLRETLSKLTEAQSQLVQSEKMASLGVLTAGVAHEINNPVNFITASTYGLNQFVEGFLEVISVYGKLDEKNARLIIDEVKQLKTDLDFDFMIENIQKVVGAINSGASRITSIVKSLRTFTREDQPEFVAMDIHENMDSTIVMLQHELKNKIELRKEYGDIPTIYGQPGKLNQVFMNIIKNAVDAIPKNGIIWVKTWFSNSNSMLYISIKDNGGGIPIPIRERIFEPFLTTKEVGKGTGLGLYISYQIVEEHQGTIELVENEEQGTEFLIRLPVGLS